MKIQEYQNLNLKKGTIHSVHWKRVINAKKGFKGRIQKETIGNFRIGVEYANMAINKDIITGSLPYGYFVFSNEILYSPSTDTYQLRLTNTFNPNMKAKATYYLDGVEITKQELIEMDALLSDEIKKKEPNPVFNVKLENIIEIK